MHPTPSFTVAAFLPPFYVHTPFSSYMHLTMLVNLLEQQKVRRRERKKELVHSIAVHQVIKPENIK